MDQNSWENRDVEPPIQPPPDDSEPAPLLGYTTDLPPVLGSNQRGAQSQRTVLTGAVFGAFVGMLGGAVVGALCCL